jgi:hypothetical protein
MDQQFIEKLLKAYKRQIEYNRNAYHNVKKHDEEFVRQNRQRAKNHYEKNRDKKREYYQQNREYMNAKSSYNYYKRKNDIDTFKTKYPEKYQQLMDRNYITST